MRSFVALLALPLLLLACGSGPADGRRVEAASLSFEVPTTWEQLPGTSDVQPIRFRVPRADSDPQDVELVMYHYGPAQAEFVPQNLENWTRLFETPEGGPGKDAALTTRRKVGSLEATMVDLAGVYTGGLSAEARRIPAAQPRPGWRMLAGAVEGADPGPWYWRMIGPGRTVAAAKPAFEAMLQSSKLAAK